MILGLTGQEWRLALTLARRELRAGPRGFGVFLACLCLGVLAMTVIGTLSASFKAGMQEDARKILGADLEAQQSHRPLPGEVLALLEERGQVSRLIRMRAMVFPAETSAGAAPGSERRSSTLVELKAVDKSYPLYGVVDLASGRSLTQALAPDPSDGLPGAAAEATLLDRLGLSVGDVLRLGQARFRVTDLVVHEPDRAASVFALGPRLFVALDSMPATGLIQPGSLLTYIYNLKLDQPESAPALRQALRERFPNPGWRLRDPSAASPALGQSLDNMTLYLTLVGLVALLVGGIGVAGAVRGFLERKEESLAALKCLGASGRLLVMSSLFQTMFLAACGSALGLVLGLGASAGIAAALRGTIDLPFRLHFDPLTLAASMGYGLLTALAFSLWPLSAAALAPPARLFRGYLDPTAKRPSRGAVLAVVLAGTSLFLLTLAHSGVNRATLGFSVGVVGCAALFFAFARGLTHLAARLPHPRNPRLRLALANLHRPGQRTAGVVFSLGLGMTALAAVTLVDGNLRRLITRQMPEEAPAFFFLDIQRDQMPAFRDSLLSLPGVTRLESQPSLRGRIIKVNGVDADSVKVDPETEWALRGDRGMTFSATPPEGTKIIAGRWWDAKDADPAPRVCFDAKLAKGFGVGVGDTLTVNVLGREITARIVCLREIEWTTLALNHSLIFAPGALDGAPYTFIATAYLDPGPDESKAATVLFKTVVQGFPTVVAVYIKDVLKDVAAIMNNLSLAVRLAASFTLLTGLLVLAETLRADLKRREYDAVIFKVLGATRRDVLLTLGIEFTLLGLAVSLCAALAGTVVSQLFVTWVLKRSWVFLPLPLLGITLFGALCALALGLTGVRKVLSGRPGPALRND